MQSHAKHWAWRAGSCAAMLFLGSSAASAAVVPLTGSSVTYDQGDPYVVAASIDGSVVGPGWAVFNGQYDAQSAIFTPAAPLNASELAFEMHQNFGGSHNINEFRISVTNAASPSEASVWTPLDITNAAAKATLVKLVDNKIRALNNTAQDEYQLRSASPFNGITGFRVEVFPYDFDATDALPATLGHATNGNFVLSEFVARDSDVGLLKNVAEGHPAIESTDGYGLNAAAGVDGVIGQGNITHTNDGDLLPFWEVDLEQSQLIDSVEIFNRDNCCPERLYNITVEVRNAADAVVYTSPVLNPTPAGGTPVNPGPLMTVDLPGAGVTGSKVRVIKDANAGAEWLSLSEVQVNIAQTLPALADAGDFNGDGLVNLEDFDILRSNFHEGTTNAQGDIDYNGEVDLYDFTQFVNAYQAANPGSPVPGSVPEPATWVLLGVGSLFLGVARRRRARG